MNKLSFAREGHHCWRWATASRLAFLIDARSYFEQLTAALELAERSVLIVGWDIHSQVELRPDAGEDGQLLRILERSVEQRSALHVHVLVWDCNVLCRLAREKLQTIRFGWQTHERIHFQLDDRHPVGACHHQKIVTVDDSVAFVGGIDLTARRWDTASHAPDTDDRVDPSGSRYAPFHDVQVAVSGAAAQALAELARDRWHRATGERLGPPHDVHDAWPSRLRADLSSVQVGIARTDFELAGEQGVREIEALYVHALGLAQRFVYIENQYLTSDAICESLAELLQRSEGPEVCIVLPLQVSGWLEDSIMGDLRERVLARLRRVDRHDRLRVWYPQHVDLDDSCIIVHSKVCVVDDRFATVGSANLSNRSMGLDTECNLFVDGQGDPNVRRAAGDLRDRLLAEHLGETPSKIAETLSHTRSLIRTVEQLRGRSKRTLVPLEPRDPSWVGQLIPDQRLLDPDSPIDWASVITNFFRFD